jgi:hypothetical protein
MWWNQSYDDKLKSHKKEEFAPTIEEITDVGFRETPYASWKAVNWVVRGAVRFTDKRAVGTNNERETKEG